MNCIIVIVSDIIRLYSEQNLLLYYLDASYFRKNMFIIIFSFYFWFWIFLQHIISNWSIYVFVKINSVIHPSSFYLWISSSVMNMFIFSTTVVKLTNMNNERVIFVLRFPDMINEWACSCWIFLIQAWFWYDMNTICPH